LTIPGMRGAKKTLTLTPIPESSVDHIEEEEEDSASQGSATTTTATATTSSVENVKFDEPRNHSPPPQHGSPTVRLVTNC
jgi:hypothetical protein